MKSAICISVAVFAVALNCPRAAGVRRPQSTPVASSNQQSSLPLSLDEVAKLIKQSKTNSVEIISAINMRGVDFDLNQKNTKKLQKAGANDDLLYEIWKATPEGKRRAQAILTSPTGTELKASASEAMAFKAIQDQADPAARVRMVSEFDKNFPSSQLLSYAYTETAKAYQEQNDFAHATEYGLKSLNLDPDNTFSLVVTAMALTQAQQNAPENKNERFRQAKADASRALTLLDKLNRLTEETDEQFQQRKGSIAADAHFVLGMVAMDGDDFDRAVSEYNAAISASSKPPFQYYYRLAEAYASTGNTDKAMDALKKASGLVRGTAMQKYVDDFMAELQRKGH